MAITLSGDAATTRTSLGLGSAATLDVGTGANQILQLDGSGNLPAVNGSALTGIDSLPTQTGNAGKALITDGSSASWGSAGAMELLASGAIDSEVAAITLDYFTSAYTHYVLHLEHLYTVNTANQILYMRLRTGSGDQTASAYHYALSHPHVTPTSGSINSHTGWNASRWQISGSNGIKGGNPVPEGACVEMHFYSPAQSHTRTHATWTCSSMEQTETQYNVHTGGGMLYSTESNGGFTLYWSADNHRKGTYALYGVAR